MVAKLDRRRVLAMIIVLLIGIGLGIGIGSIILPSKTETHTVTSTLTHFFWEGTGTGAQIDRLTFRQNYDQLHKKLKEKFGDRLMEVGYADSARSKWVVLLDGAKSPTTPEEVDFVRSLFPLGTTLQIVGISKYCSVVVLESYPPIIEIRCP